MADPIGTNSGASAIGIQALQNIVIAINKLVEAFGIFAPLDSPVFTGYIKVDPVTVAGLPSAVTAGIGAIAFVSDANATTFNSVVAGGGSNKLPVHSDGTDWRIG